jgi:4'-phosphopantetheinyl transferase
LAEVSIYWEEFNENRLNETIVSKLNQDLLPEFQLDLKTATAPQQLSFYAKVMLSNILDRYFSIKNSLKTFKKDIHGKPSIEQEDLYFNISHSKNIVSIAICKKAPIGIDVQKIKKYSEGVAKRVFHKVEAEEYLKCDDQSIYFFDTWSKKEAAVKATGRGIKTGLTSFNVQSLADGSSLMLDEQELYLQSISIKEGFSSAIAVNHEITDVIINNFQLKG